jgi:Spy/CpxP family protein refolding chaperone
MAARIEMRNWKTIAGVIGVFALGMVAGGLLTARVVYKRAQSVAKGEAPLSGELLARRLGWELKLTQPQREQLRDIMMASQLQMRDLRRQTQPQVATILRETDAKIRAILSPDQAEKFDKIVAERKARWMENQPPRPMMPPPPRPPRE